MPARKDDFDPKKPVLHFRFPANRDVEEWTPVRATGKNLAEVSQGAVSYRRKKLKRWEYSYRNRRRITSSSRRKASLEVVKICKSEVELEKFFSETRQLWRAHRAPQSTPDKLADEFNAQDEAGAFKASKSAGAGEEQLEASTTADSSPGSPLQSVPASPSAVSPPSTSIGVPLWKNREADDKRSPYQFIQDEYGNKVRGDSWRHEGMARQQLKRDPELYAAYAVWISRYPNQRLEFAPAFRVGGRPPNPNPIEAIERKRASTRASVARHRAKAKGERMPFPD